MREIKNLNTDESIVKKRLVFDEGWDDKFNHIGIYIIFSPFLYLPITLYFNEKFTSPNDEIILHYIFPISILFGLYIFYRNATEKRLIKIVTHINRKKARQILLEYAEKQGYEIYRKSSDCLIFNEEYSDLSSSFKKTRIIFVQDNFILFAVIRDGARFNFPTIFTHLFLKLKFRHLFKKPAPNTGLA